MARPSLWWCARTLLLYITLTAGRDILLLAFAKMRTQAKTVNCYDPASYEDFIRLYSGEIAGLLEKYNESTQLVA